MISSKDVDQKAGVSQPTVSRVLNNPAKREAGNQTESIPSDGELGYYPNLIARSLVSNRTRTIALVSGTLKNSYFVEMTDSIIHFNKSRGYTAITYFEDENQAPDFFDSVMGHKVDGLLLSLITLDDPLFGKIEKAKIPCVFFNRKPCNGGQYVVLGNVLAAQLVTRHILSLGHRNIAYLSGKKDISTFFERTLWGVLLPVVGRPIEAGKAARGRRRR